MPESILHRNHTTLDRLFRMHSSWLTGWLNRQRWTVHSSEDLASDVFCALLAIPNLDAVSQPRAMMTTIARRLIYDARRRDDLRRSYESELMALPEALEISAEERLILIQALQAVEAMLSTLSHADARLYIGWVIRLRAKEARQYVKTQAKEDFEEGQT